MAKIILQAQHLNSNLLRLLILKKDSFSKKLFPFATILILFLLGGNQSIFAQCADTSPTGDCDGDLVLNGVDLDDDNDGILDIDEGCGVGGSSLEWGTALWTGGSPGNDFATVSVTTVNFVEFTADNSTTDFGGLPSYAATSGTSFNGTEGLLLQAPLSEFLNSVNTIRYEISFDTPVTGLSFRIVDIDKRITADANGDPFTDQLTITISNGGTPFVPISGTDYTIGSAVTDLSGGVFEGNSIVNNVATSDGDIIYTLTGPVDNLLIEFTNVDPTVTVASLGNTAFLISNMVWDCSNRDFDNDGNQDSIDNDSDADGCPDALEGDGGFTLADLDGDNSLGDTVDANGVPTIAAGGQNDVSSIDVDISGGECDDDGDLLTNTEEGSLGTDPDNPDTDGDGINDGQEVTDTTDPLNPCDPAQIAGYTGYDAGNAIWAAADCDSDGATNGSEDTAGSDPYDAGSTPATDTDGDGDPDVTDTAPNDPCLPVQSAGYTGYDAGNTIWAAADCDNDLVTNGDEDTAGSDPYDAASTPATDTDGDGDPDVTDTAPNDPCLPVQSAGYTGYDAGNAIWAAADCDNDLVTNGDEDTAGSDPYDAASTPATDTDGDGDPDVTDTAPNDPCLPVQSAGYTGYDAGNAIWAAADCDSDGVTNGDEDTNGTDPYAASADTDGDGIDDDNEINNATDQNNPCDPAQTAGYTGYDAGNAIWAAADCDSDGVTNGDEDTNGTDPYAASADTDGDGIDDDNEINNATDQNNPCDPAQTAGYTGYDAGNAIWAAADCDSDGVTNGDEDTNGTDPYAASVDTDGDGIDDDNEINNATDQNNPCDPAQTAGYTGYDAGNAIWAAADCDTDGVTNGDEDTAGSDPYDAGSTPTTDTDGDGNPDVTDSAPNDPCLPVQSAGYTGYDAGNAIWAAADCDNDLVTNGDEDTAGSDPYDAASTPTTDTDGDGVPDVTDTAPNDPCLPVQSAGYTGYDAGNAIWAAADCDSDGVTNGDEDTAGSDPYDAGSTPATDTDGDGVPDVTDTAPNDSCLPVQSAGYTGYDAGNSIWAAADCDTDGVTNGDEDTAGSDPYDAGSTPTTDTDGDGNPDVTDSAPNDPCLPVQSAGYTGYDAGNSIWAAADCDGDGVTNGDEDIAGSDPYFDDSGTLDDDNDGVPNSLDLCDNTPPNAVVDVTGCEVFTLPNTNFNILSTGETCISSNDGIIEINTETSLDYTATLTGSMGSIPNSFTTTTSFTNLTAGDYTLCFTVLGQPNYENCFSVKISEPEALSVDSKVSTSKNEVTLDLSGGQMYYIELNNISYQTSDSKIILPLSQIENIISVRTDKDCQGFYEETIMLSSKVIIYPNPISLGELTIYLGNNTLNNVQLSLYTINGVEVFNKPYSTINNEVKLAIDTLPNGSYILKIKTEKSLLNYKIIKR